MWDFGDGVKAGGEPATHTYTQPGTYNAKVTVTDPGDKSATATVQIVVKRQDDDERRRGRAAARPRRRAGRGRERPAGAVGKRFGVARVLRRGLRYTVTCERGVPRDLGAAGSRPAARQVQRPPDRGRPLAQDRAAARSQRPPQPGGGDARGDVRSLQATLVLKVRTADGTKTIRSAVTLRR